MLIRPRFVAKRNAFNMVGSLFGLSQNGAILGTRPDNLFFDAARTTPITAPGDPVGGATDLSGNGNHFAQPSDPDRMIYGVVPASGRRNLLERTEELDNPWWSKNSSDVFDNAATDPLDRPATNIIPKDGETSESFLSHDFGSSFGGSIHSITAKANGFRFLKLRFTSTPARSFVVDLLNGSKLDITGSQTDNTEARVEDLGDGWWSIDVYTKGFDRFFYISIQNELSQDDADAVVGDGVSGVLVSGLSKKLTSEDFSGTDITPNVPYQKVTNQFDVTEAGVRSIPYLDQSEANQSLEVQIPDLGTDAAIAYAYGADTGGVVIAQGLTVPGPRDLPGVDKIHDFVARDAALTGAAKDRLLQYLWRSRSDEPVGNLVAPGPIDLIGDAPATVKDEAGANDGTNDGAKAAVADGVAGLEFDGTRRIAASHALSASPHTIACRVRPFVFVDGAQHIAGERSSGAFNTFLRLSSDTVEAFTVDGGGNNVSASISIPDRLNEWVFIAASYDGETLRLQVDDEVTTASATTPGYTITDGVEWSMGRRSGTAGDRFTGVLADVSRWDAALSSEEVDSIKNTRLTGEETNLGSYWPMADINDENDIEVWT